MQEDVPMLETSKTEESEKEEEKTLKPLISADEAQLLEYQYRVMIKQNPRLRPLLDPAKSKHWQKHRNLNVNPSKNPAQITNEILFAREFPVPSKEELQARYNQTLALSSADSMDNLFSLDSLCDSMTYCRPEASPIVDDGDTGFNIPENDYKRMIKDHKKERKERREQEKQLLKDGEPLPRKKRRMMRFSKEQTLTTVKQRMTAPALPDQTILNHDQFRSEVLHPLSKMSLSFSKPLPRVQRVKDQDNAVKVDLRNYLITIYDNPNAYVDVDGNCNYFIYEEGQERGYFEDGDSFHDSCSQKEKDYIYYFSSRDALRKFTGGMPPYRYSIARHADDRLVNPFDFDARSGLKRKRKKHKKGGKKKKRKHMYPGGRRRRRFKGTGDFKKVWEVIATREMPKGYKQFVSRQAAVLSNLKKTAQLCKKGAKRRNAAIMKLSHQAPHRAKRFSREIITYWRKYDREERENRKTRQKEARIRRKEEEEEREAKRQQKKLNFLLTQTELYSYFIGRKMGLVREEDSIEPHISQFAPGPTTTLSTGVPSNGGTGARANRPSPVGERMTVRMSVEQKAKAAEEDRKENELLQQQARANALRALETQKKKTQVFDKQMQIARAQSLEDSRKLQEQEERVAARRRELAAATSKTKSATPPRSPPHSSTEKDSAASPGPKLDAPSTMPAQFVATPSLFQGKLKKYQRKGLSWLANLYEQGINGILADEMGLGKTVQSIAFLSYLAEQKGIWGPFLVLAPTSTLHNWQQECAKFCPSLQVLPYWGTQADRKTIRKYWNTKDLYTKDSAFHVLITNYNLVVKDERYFQRMKWEYMILDEAQAIKSSTSARWKSLLAFHCRNRLLLTGTPIQNSMAELWSLLHFIMPTLFDSHEEFTEWFSKDIENHALASTSNTKKKDLEKKSKLNEHQLRRLHMILKPFMLRRLKGDVESEMPKKSNMKCYATCPPAKKNYTAR